MAPIVPERRRKRRIEGEEEPSETFIHPSSSSPKEGKTNHGDGDDGSLFLAIPVTVTVTVTDHDNDGSEDRNDPSVSPAKKARLTTTFPSNHHPPTVPSVAISGTAHHEAQPVARRTPNQVTRVMNNFTVPRSGAKTPSCVPRVGAKTPSCVPSVGAKTPSCVPSVGAKTPSCVPRVGAKTPSSVRKLSDDSFDTNIESGYRFSSSVLGEGGFSKVREGVHVKTGIKVAIKCMDKVRLGPDEPRVKTEIQALKTLGRHENIARLYQVVETSSRIFLVMELCRGGELFDFIVKSGRLSEQVSRMILNQLLQALSFIHSKGFAHRDLKPENILLSSQNQNQILSESKTGKSLDRQYEHFRNHPEDVRIKLIDFGLAADCSGSGSNSSSKSGGIESLSTCCGSPAYAAPELISGSGSSYSGRKIDVWSTGIISFACLVGKLPFQDDSSLSALYKLILSGSYSVPPHVSPVARTFIASMLQVDPDKRAPVSQLLAHPFLQEKSSSGSSSMSEPFPIKVSEENLSEEILWFLQKKYFPETPLSELRRNIRSKFGYQTASYWLLKDHPYLHGDSSSSRSSNDASSSSSSRSSNDTSSSSSSRPSYLTTGSAKKPMSPKPLLPSETERVKLFSRFQHPKDSTPSTRLGKDSTPSTRLGKDSTPSTRPRRDTTAPSPAVHFLSVPIPSNKNRDPRVTNDLVLHPDSSVKDEGRRRPSTSPGHALSPLHNLNNVSIWSQSPRHFEDREKTRHFEEREKTRHFEDREKVRHFEDREKVKRPLFLSTGKQERMKRTGGSVERLLSTPDKDGREGKEGKERKEAATTGKKVKKGNKLIGLIRHKLFH